jgi:predicted metalloprotease
VRRLPTLAALAALIISAPACGGEDAQRAADSARERVDQLQEEGERLRDRARAASEEFGRRVGEVLEKMRQAVPEASLPAPRVREPTALEAYMQVVLESVDGYWTRTLRASGLQEPRVGYYWVPPGGRVLTACRVVADDNAAFYCSADDAIYVAARFANAVYRGIADDLPGERAGRGNAVGEFGLAYVIAHEYAHNVQFELGFYQLLRPEDGVKAFELQADCMAGLWGNAAYRAGRYDAQDVEQAISTAQAVGDFDFGTAQHHGTPDERRAAWLDGFRTGDPARCRRYVPGT